MDTKPEPPTHLSMEELRDEEMRKLQQSLRETQNRLESELEITKMLGEANERISKERDKLRADFDNQAVSYSDRIAALEHRAGYARHRPECLLELDETEYNHHGYSCGRKCTCGLDEVQKD
jgi:hypothetical protein